MGADGQGAGNGTPAELPRPASAGRPDLPDALQQARELKAAGRLLDAAEKCREALIADDDCFEAWHLLATVEQNRGCLADALAAGVRAIACGAGAADAGARSRLALAHSRQASILRAMKQRDAAMISARHALSLDPNCAEAHNNLGNCLRECGRSEDAIEHYRQALVINPNYVESLNNLGVALAETDRVDAAITSYRRALLLKPNFANAHFNLANALAKQRLWAEAIDRYREAVRLRKVYPVAWNNLGRALSEDGRHDEARDCYREAVRQRPDYFEALNNLGVANCRAREFSAAEASFREAIRLQPDSVKAHNNLGVALKELKRLEESEATLRHAIALDAHHPDARSNLGQVLKLSGRFDEAVANGRRAVALAPRNATYHYNLALTLKQALRFAEAEANLRRAIALRPDYPEARFDLALLLLALGNFTEGWRQYEQRWLLRYDPENRPSCKVDIEAPDWQGEPLTGKTIVVGTEQGLGDTIQFARYLPGLARMADRVTFLVPANLRRLLSALEPLIEVTAATRRDRRFDYRCSLMSLPGLFGTDFGANPPPPPTPIDVAPVAETHWRQRLGDKGFKIGVCWQGNPTARIDEGRSVPLAAFAPLARIPNVRLISLQKNYGLEQLDTLPEGMVVEALGDGFDAGSDAFVDSAAVLLSLDLVVTSDTGIAHLASSLGRPVWLALGVLPEWRWQMDRADTPWYPTMTLFRQKRRGDWSSIFAEMADCLVRTLSDRAPSTTGSMPCAPISWGELIDKITILEIKSDRVSAPDALANIRRELEALNPMAAAALLGTVGLQELKRSLRRINESLWQIEDDIRTKEARREFDGAFVELARSVYKSNDERGRIKRAINKLLGSTLIEEKQYVQY